MKEDLIQIPMQLPLSAWRVPLSAEDAEMINKVLK